MHEPIDARGRDKAIRRSGGARSAAAESLSEIKSARSMEIRVKDKDKIREKVIE